LARHRPTLGLVRQFACVTIFSPDEVIGRDALDLVFLLRDFGDNVPSMKQNNYTFGWHLVAFLDVLGQRERFRQLKVPTTPAEVLTVNEVLMQTAHFVNDLRDQFKEEFLDFDRRLSMKRPVVESLMPKFVGFSDSFVISIGLWDAKDDFTFFAKVYSTLSAASSLMLTSLGKAHALRGGIDVDLGCEIADGEVYGTALEKAYLLECRAAEYPRILIGGGLWKYLADGLVEFESRKTPEADKICNVIRKSKEFMAIDSDGRRILDYMGAFMKTISLPGAAENLILPAYKFVVAESDAWIKKGNVKLAGRYAVLRRYFEERLHIWGLKPDDVV